MSDNSEHDPLHDDGEGEEEDLGFFGEAASSVVEKGNEILAESEEADLWAVASGMLAGAVQFWLFSRQPCDKSECEDCAEINTAQKRLQSLLEEARGFAEQSDYFHSPNDADTGTA
jgi:hypothetical protein